MATITVRIEDDLRDGLQARAEDEGVTVSDLVRDLIREAVVDVRSGDELRDGYVPETLSPKDRHVLALLRRILACVTPEDEDGLDGDRDYQLERAAVLEEGLTLEYPQEFTAIESELSKRDSSRVMDILDMFRVVKDSIEKLENDGIPVDPNREGGLMFAGFDFNDPLEAKMASYVRFLVDHDRWAEQKEFVHGRTAGNSHMPVLDMYLRMLAEYRRIMKGGRFPGSRGLLSVDELRAISDAAVHPSRR